MRLHGVANRTAAIERQRKRHPREGAGDPQLAVQGAVPLQFNAYKIPLMRNLVKRAITGTDEPRTQEAPWTSSSGQ